MIVSRASIVKENQGEFYYDYGAVLVPQGMLSPETVYFFSQENVDDIVQMGFINYEETAFADQYDEMITNATVDKGNVGSSANVNGDDIQGFNF